MSATITDTTESLQSCIPYRSKPTVWLHQRRLSLDSTNQGTSVISDIPNTAHNKVNAGYKTDLEIRPFSHEDHKWLADTHKNVHHH